MPQDLKDGFMLQRVKSLLKVKFKNYNWSLGLVALVQILKSLTYAIPDCSAFDETILVLMDALHDYCLKPICSHFGQNFKPHTSKRDWSEVSHFLRGKFFWAQE